MVANNGHSNGTGARGGLHGEDGSRYPQHPNATPRMRAGMQMIAKLVEKGHMAPDELAGILEWAKTIRDDPKVSERVRMRAAELMAKVSERIVAAGLDLEKLERLDTGEATERVETRDITVTVPRVGRIDE